MGPMDTVIAGKFIKTGLCREKNDTTEDMPPHNIFKTGTELMYGGQGKITNTINLMQVTKTRETEGRATDPTTIMTKTGGLAQPLLDNTNKEVTGDNKGKLRKQNK